MAGDDDIIRRSDGHIQDRKSSHPVPLRGPTVTQQIISCIKLKKTAAWLAFNSDIMVSF